MFADLHHLHQFISLEQGGAVTAVSTAGGTGAGEADIYFGAHSSNPRPRHTHAPLTRTPPLQAPPT
jgi:hypothetical protein